MTWTFTATFIFPRGNLQLREGWSCSCSAHGAQRKTQSSRCALSPEDGRGRFNQPALCQASVPRERLLCFSISTSTSAAGNGHTSHGDRLHISRNTECVTHTWVSWQYFRLGDHLAGPRWLLMSVWWTEARVNISFRLCEFTAALLQRSSHSSLNTEECWDTPGLGWRGENIKHHFNTNV